MQKAVLVWECLHLHCSLVVVVQRWTEDQWHCWSGGSSSSKISVGVKVLSLSSLTPGSSKILTELFTLSHLTHTHTYCSLPVLSCTFVLKSMDTLNVPTTVSFRHAPYTPLPNPPALQSHTSVTCSPFRLLPRFSLISSPSSIFNKISLRVFFSPLPSLTPSQWFIICLPSLQMRRCFIYSLCLCKKSKKKRRRNSRTVLEYDSIYNQLTARVLPKNRCVKIKSSQK